MFSTTPQLACGSAFAKSRTSLKSLALTDQQRDPRLREPQRKMIARGLIPTEEEELDTVGRRQILGE